MHEDTNHSLLFQCNVNKRDGLQLTICAWYSLEMALNISLSSSFGDM
jgi:hypothetical protein